MQHTRQVLLGVLFFLVATVGPLYAAALASEPLADEQRDGVARAVQRLDQAGNGLVKIFAASQGISAKNLAVGRIMRNPTLPAHIMVEIWRIGDVIVIQGCMQDPPGVSCPGPCPCE